MLQIKLVNNVVYKYTFHFKSSNKNNIMQFYIILPVENTSMYSVSTWGKYVNVQSVYMGNTSIYSLARWRKCVNLQSAKMGKISQFTVCLGGENKSIYRLPRMGKYFNLQSV